MQTRLSSLLSAIAVFLLVFTVPIVGAAGVQAAHDGSRDGHAFPFLRWLRDSTIEVIFGRPTSRNKNKSVKPSGALPARYQHDVVVRFNVTNSEEEGALSEAANRLFLDVWAFTREYVDVRIHKDDIAPLMTVLPATLQPSVLIPNLAEAVAATYPSKPMARNQFDPNRIDPAMLRTSVDSIDNIFFRDYQPLSVSLLPYPISSPLPPPPPRATRIGGFWRRVTDFT